MAAEKSASGCIVYAIDTNKFLLIKRSGKVDTPNTWAVVGGESKPFEMPYQTALRELVEETQFKEQILYKSHISTYKMRDFTYETFLVVVKSEFIPVLNEESSDWKWLTLEDLYKSQFNTDSHFGLTFTLKTNFSEILRALSKIEER